MNLYKKVSILQIDRTVLPLACALWFSLNFCQIQISAAEFTCPPWLSFGAMKLITRILDPNPMTVSSYALLTFLA
jgi:hypothetical protein